jgi:hypothetical protein
MVPPAGFAPPPPAPAGFAPAPSYQTPGMALTELSFAPIAVDAPPAPPAPVEPPSASLVSDVLPSGGVARRISLGGRTPLIALVVVLLLAAGGVVFGTGLLKKKDEAPIVVPKGKAPVVAPQASKPAVVAPVKPKAVKPVAKPVVKPLVGKTLTVTKANSRTFGGAYTVTVPTGWQSQLNLGRNARGNTDLAIGHDRTQQGLVMSSVRPSFAAAPLTAARFAALKAGLLGVQKDAKVLPGTVVASIAGAKTFAYDATMTGSDGKPISVRNVMFEHDGVIYSVVWGTSSPSFTKSLPTFNQILATVKFAK